MRIKTHLRIAPTNRGFRVLATSRPNIAPISDALGEPLPTVAFAVVFNLPDDAFMEAERVIAEIDVPARALEVAAEVP